MIKKQLLLGFIFLALIIGVATPIHAEEQVTVKFFWGTGCPYCEMQKPYMEDLADKYPEIIVESYEVYNDLNNRALFQRTAADYGTTPRAVPMTFIGNKYWSGFHERMIPEMQAEIERQLDELENDVEQREIISIPFIGDVEISAMPLFLATGLIAFVDGFNPCSLWLLTFLLGILLYTRSRKKIIIIGLTFLLTTAAAYGAFMLGLLNIFLYVGYLDVIVITVGVIALLFAAVNIKDYFWYKKGVSFTISDKHKPGLFNKVRRIMHPETSMAGMIIGTIILALGVTLVELPCTAGFPVVWTNIMALHSPPLIEFALLFSMYLMIYLAVEIVILGTAVVTLKRSSFEEKHGRILKLIGGVIMLALAYGIVFQRELMESISGVIRLFGVAALIIIAILLIHRVILPLLGIVIGTEKLGRKKKQETPVEQKNDKKKRKRK